MQWKITCTPYARVMGGVARKSLCVSIEGPGDARCLEDWFSTCHCEVAWPRPARLSQTQMAGLKRCRSEAARPLPTISSPSNKDTVQLPATARSSNQVATVYAVQDVAQRGALTSRQESEMMLTNIGTQISGRTSNTTTAERVSKMFGKVDREHQSTSA